MLGIDKRAARASWTVCVVAAGIALAYLLRDTLAAFAAAVLFAYLLLPVIAFVQRFTPARFPHTLALSLVYLALLGALAGSVVTVGAKIVDEANNLASRLPQLAQNRHWLDTLPLPLWLEPARQRIGDFIEAQVHNGGQDLLPYAQQAGTRLLHGASYLIYLVLIPILAFFFLKDGPMIHAAILRQFGGRGKQDMVAGILFDIDKLLGHYIRALVLLSLSSFTLYSLFLGLTGASYSFLLAGVAAVFEFIPVVGPFAAGMIALLVAGLSGYGHLGWFVAFWVLLRLFQDYVLSPHLMGAGVELNPVLVLFGVLAGEQIAGVSGMFFSVPVLATLRVVFVRLRLAGVNPVE